MLVSSHISVPSLSRCPLYLSPLHLFALMQDNSFYDYLVIHSSVEGEGIGGGGGVVADGGL